MHILSQLMCIISEAEILILNVISTCSKNMQKNYSAVFFYMNWSDFTCILSCYFVLSLLLHNLDIYILSI